MESAIFGLLYFPYKAKLAEQQINEVNEYIASPPDYKETFEECQYQYATLGIAAWELAGKLRKHVNLPQRSSIINGDWNPISSMESRKSEIELQRRSKRTNILPIMTPTTPQC
ncbi:MAG: hypothetical protein SD837_16405 [Candidatus Electrothrix scaldis]|nr:MAG: hypothetical protein SD837_16405 [Candidatus Electrothrix sp. GW3-3]